MQTEQSWLGDQAFGEDAGELVTVRYKSHHDALKFTEAALSDERGVAMLQGPRGSGKTTTVRRLADKIPSRIAVALLDGTRIKPRELLSRMLAQFGYDTGLQSTDELEKMIGVFAVQQARSVAPPVLIIDNVDRMYPSALRILNSLAAVSAQGLYALRIIGTGREGLGAIIRSGNMGNIATRSVGDFMLAPLSLREALLYLHAKLGACGVNNADTVFPVDVCDRLYQQSGGWPGLLNEFASAAIGRAKTFPLKVSDTEAQEEVAEDAQTAIPVLSTDDAVGRLPPRLILTIDGKTVRDFTITEKKALIGRSDFADIVVDDDFVSKLHAVLLLYSDALVLLDLNSANGITVNSVTIRSTILKSDDIISLGNHRLKVENAPPISEEMERLIKTPDTIKMKNLLDVRQKRAARLKLAASKRK